MDKTVSEPTKPINKDLNLLQKMDFVLDKLNIQNTTPDWLLIRKTVGADVDNWILDKLVLDKYVIRENSKYHITMDGKFFIENGGYYGRVIQANALAYRQKIISGFLLASNIILALGAISASWYYFHELYVYYFVP